MRDFFHSLDSISIFFWFAFSSETTLTTSVISFLKCCYKDYAGDAAVSIQMMTDFFHHSVFAILFFTFSHLFVLLATNAHWETCSDASLSHKLVWTPMRYIISLIFHFQSTVDCISQHWKIYSVSSDKLQRDHFKIFLYLFISCAFS